MRRAPNRLAFTLIEVLIVVVIMAVLAATIIPQFSSSTTDAKDSTLKFNVHTMRSQIELYKIHHDAYPTLDVTNADLPQLTGSTDAAGTVGTGAAYPFGPYIDEKIPANPFDGENRVVAVAVAGQTPTAVADALGGWQYDVTTGRIWPNNPEFFQ